MTMKTKPGPISEIQKQKLRAQAGVAGRVWASIYHAKTPHEQAAIIARAVAGRARWHARKYGLPEPVIQTFDATMEPGKGVTQTSPLREFDL